VSETEGPALPLNMRLHGPVVIHGRRLQFVLQTFLCAYKRIFIISMCDYLVVGEFGNKAKNRTLHEICCSSNNEDHMSQFKWSDLRGGGCFTTDGQAVSMSRYRAHSAICDQILLPVGTQIRYKDSVRSSRVTSPLQNQTG
jgi:hypothetical protein